ncbi:methyltransferase domain-containing protein [Maribacter sp. PR1]|uniref:Methyltransferase domain-containing protein n=1 Tax=Maribacter cobaltidurans TaxID=1178778 RepID=A0ABU7ISE2_9FLAO|nr:MULTISPECIES: methyltransferase domain-containing protein [Maribacter]MDC6388405.1 methyltransferase domain-containing protein [Maribacter sp. PR1]MEE1975794.1 methyltransferase domain-containing protein [Maribacter cobaltidurans]
MIDLTFRSTRKELLDDFQGTSKQLKTVLEDINRVNRLLGGNVITVDAVFRLIKENEQKSYTILDVGCGDGNMLRQIAIKARKRSISLKLIGLELSDGSLNIARQKSTHFPEIQYLNQDVFTLDKLDVDIVLTTLTLHHFRQEDIPQFVGRFAKMANLGVIINDLHRSGLAYYLFRAFSIFFIKTHTARSDGLTSITRGFKRKELQQFATNLPGTVHEISWKWAFRYQWIIKKEE